MGACVCARVVHYNRIIGFMLFGSIYFMEMSLSMEIEAKRGTKACVLVVHSFIHPYQYMDYKQTISIANKMPINIK